MTSTTLSQVGSWFCCRLRCFNFTFVLLLLASISCTNKNEVKKQDFVDGHIFAYEKGAPIPDKLVALTEKSFVKIYKESKPDTSLSDAEIAVSVPRRLLELDVEFLEKNSGTLVHNSRFALPPGGGAIDFAELVNQGKGLFFLKIRPRLEVQDLSPESLRVFYVSNSKKFTVHGKEYGAGCGRFFDITDYYKQVIATSGYELAAADGRYLGQVLGTFYFITVDLKGVFVSGVSFIDTRYPQAHCLPPQVGGAYQ